MLAFYRRVLAIPQRPSWPPPHDAVTSAGAEAATGTHAGDLHFAWSTAATIEPWVEGVNFFPRIFADVEAAASSVHILMFGWREGTVGHAWLSCSREVAWTGGAGLEDHFENGGFHDVMVRITGDVVRQAQAAFLTSFQGHGGPLPGDLSSFFPEQADPGTTPIALAQVIPGGLVAASEAIRGQIDAARDRLDIVNAYLTDPDVIGRIIEAARRGVKVRLLVSETSNNAQATAALRHRYAELAAAGVEVWELPGTVVHAKVVVADDVVSFGTVNLDAWALYRNSEIMMIARSADLAELLEERLFDPDIARAKRGEPPSGSRERLECWLADKLAFVL